MQRKARTDAEIQTAESQKKKNRKRKKFSKAASENHLTYQRTMIGITAELTGTTEDRR